MSFSFFGGNILFGFQVANYFWFLLKVVTQQVHQIPIVEQLFMLGSKDLGTNVFRTLMCIVGKP